jgi:hypothetical protein
MVTSNKGYRGDIIPFVRSRRFTPPRGRSTGSIVPFDGSSRKRSAGRRSQTTPPITHPNKSSRLHASTAQRRRDVIRRFKLIGSKIGRESRDDNAMMRKVRKVARGITQRVYAFIEKNVGDVTIQRNILLMSVCLLILKKLPQSGTVKGASKFCLEQYVYLQRELMQIDVDKESQMRHIDDLSEKEMVWFRQRAELWKLCQNTSWQAVVSTTIASLNIGSLLNAYY